MCMWGEGGRGTTRCVCGGEGGRSTTRCVCVGGGGGGRGTIGVYVGEGAEVPLDMYVGGGGQRYH